MFWNHARQRAGSCWTAYCKKWSCIGVFQPLNTKAPQRLIQSSHIKSRPVMRRLCYYFCFHVNTKKKGNGCPLPFRFNLRVLCWPPAACLSGTFWYRLCPLLRHGVLLTVSRVLIRHIMARIFICSAHKSAFCDALTSEIFLPHVYYNKLRNNYQYMLIFINIISVFLAGLLSSFAT